MRWKVNNIRKVQIKREKAALFPNTRMVNYLISRTAEFLLYDGLDIMLRLEEEFH